MHLYTNFAGDTFVWDSLCLVLMSAPVPPFYAVKIFKATSILTEIHTFLVEMLKKSEVKQNSHTSLRWACCTFFG